MGLCGDTPGTVTMAGTLDQLQQRTLKQGRLLHFPTTFGCQPYIAMVAEVHPGCVRDMCAYMRLLKREVQKY